MDLTPLLPTIRPRGRELPLEERDKAAEVIDQIDFDQDELESWEAQGVAVGAFRTRLGLLVGEKTFTHSREQLEEAERLRRRYKEDGIDLPSDVEKIVGVGKLATVARVYDGYADDEDAVQDACRALLYRVVEDRSFSRASGWRDDVVLLISSANYFLVCRTHTDGRIDIEPEEHVLDAYACYASELDELAQELTSIDRYEQDQPLPPGTDNLVSAWLRKEGADALLNQSRYNLTAAMRIFRLNESISTADLARSLHTDRGNLSKQLAKAATGKL